MYLISDIILEHHLAFLFLYVKIDANTNREHKMVHKFYLQ